jgi:hypothetical protein
MRPHRFRLALLQAMIMVPVLGVLSCFVFLRLNRSGLIDADVRARDDAGSESGSARGQVIGRRFERMASIIDGVGAKMAEARSSR